MRYLEILLSIITIMSNKISKANLDLTDLKILGLLQQNGALSSTELSETLSMSLAPCWRRKKRLEEIGIIKSYQANLDRKQLGIDVLAFVQIRFGQHSGIEPDQFEEKICELDQVLSCHKVTGEADYLLTIIATDLEGYGHFVENILRKQPGIISIQSSLSLREIKNSSRIPVNF